VKSGNETPVKHSLGTKLLAFVFLAGVLAYFGVQLREYIADPLLTAPAYRYQVEKSLSLTGYMIRRERVLSESGGGLLRLQREEGERVSAGGTVALVYADQASVDRQAEIAALETRVSQMEYAQEASGSTEVARKLDSQIKRTLLEYRTSLASDRLADAENHGGTLRGLVVKRDYAYSNTEDLEGKLSEARAELKSLQSQAALSVQRITAPEAGLYSAVVDGFESVLTPEGVEDLTPSTLSALRPEGETSQVGKLILGDEWYYAAIVSKEEAQTLSEAGSVALRFTKNVELDLPVTLLSTGAEESGRMVAVFQGKTYLSQLTLLRQQSAQAVLGSVEGIRIPVEALRILPMKTVDEDGEEREVQTSGVFCVVGAEARFKPVEVLYTGDGFLLARSPAGTEELLRLRQGDEVILSARDLYDGKVVRQAND